MTRQSLIAKAASLPQGSSERRDILAYLKEARSETFGKLFWWDDGRVEWLTNIDPKGGQSPGRGGAQASKSVESAIMAAYKQHEINTNGWRDAVNKKLNALPTKKSNKEVLWTNDGYTTLQIQNDTLFVYTTYNLRVLGDFRSHGITQEQLLDVMKDTSRYFMIHPDFT